MNGIYKFTSGSKPAGVGVFLGFYMYFEDVYNCIARHGATTTIMMWLPPVWLSTAPWPVLGLHVGGAHCPWAPARTTRGPIVSKPEGFLRFSPKNCALYQNPACGYLIPPNQQCSRLPHARYLHTDRGGITCWQISHSLHIVCIHSSHHRKSSTVCLQVANTSAAPHAPT